MSTATETTPADTFVILLQKGFWPVAIYPKGWKQSPDRISLGKNPIGIGWGLERWTLEKASRNFRDFKGAGVGICLGPGRGPGGTWLIDIEGDGPEAEDSRATLMGGEDPPTMGWASTRGDHRVMTADDRLTKIMPRLGKYERKDKLGKGVYKFDQLPGLELRVGGYKADGTIKQTQSVVPPTPGTNGEPREWTGPLEVAPVPDSFYEFLEYLAVPATEEATEEGTQSLFAGTATNFDARSGLNGTTDEGVEANRINNYVMTALADEAAKVAGTPEGGRHDAMLSASMNMAGLIKGAGFPEDVYRRVLLDAARQCGLPDGEALGMIESAIPMATPRDLSKARGWKPDAKVERNGHYEANGKASDPPVYATLADAVAVIGDLRWVWNQWLPAGCMTILAAVGGGGKTRTALDLCRRLWFGLEMPDGSQSSYPAGTKTLWMMYDSNWAETGEAARNFGVPHEAILLAALKDNPLANPDFDDPSTMMELTRQIEHQQPGLIVIDTITYATGRNTSKASEAKAAFDGLMKVAGVTSRNGI